MGIVKKESNEHEDLLDEVHINLAHESEITQNSVFSLVSTDKTLCSPAPHHPKQLGAGQQTKS